jgi:glutamate/tyrosine decarboxylase-like PLP-dependent enzyme
MLKPPHALAAIAYFLTMQINPNNHALDGGPATAEMEMEVMADLASLFGYAQSWSSDFERHGSQPRSVVGGPFDASGQDNRIF